jgi:hypothetical protein
MTDVLRRYPDAAPACVDTIAAIPEEVGRAAAACLSLLPCLADLSSLPFAHRAPAELSMATSATDVPATSLMHYSSPCPPHPPPLLPSSHPRPHTHPHHHPHVPTHPPPPLQDIVEAPARAAYLWVVGEYGAQIQDAPYVLEELAGRFAEEEPPAKLVCVVGGRAKGEGCLGTSSSDCTHPSILLVGWVTANGLRWPGCQPALDCRIALTMLGPPHLPGCRRCSLRA